MNCFADIIAAFGGLQPFVDATGIEYSAVVSMRDRNSIPPKRWKVIEAAARVKGIEGLDRYSICNMVLSQFPDVDLTPPSKPRPAERVSV